MSLKQQEQQPKEALHDSRQAMTPVCEPQFPLSAKAENVNE